MEIIVQKYGGSSLSDVDKIMQVARMIARVKQEGLDVAAVVSAMGKTTNQLVAMARTPACTRVLAASTKGSSRAGSAQASLRWSVSES